MILQKSLTAALLLFVATSLVVLVIGLVREPSATPPADQAGPATRAKLIVYYFHGSARCPTCRAIEDQTRETLQTRFAGELARGEIAWQVVNFDAPGNQHFARQFALVAVTVVLADGRTSPPTRWKALEDVWAHVKNRTAFQDYIHREVSRFLEEPQ